MLLMKNKTYVGQQ